MKPIEYYTNNPVKKVSPNEILKPLIDKLDEQRLTVKERTEAEAKAVLDARKIVDERNKAWRQKEQELGNEWWSDLWEEIGPMKFLNEKSKVILKNRVQMEVKNLHDQRDLLRDYVSVIEGVLETME